MSFRCGEIVDVDLLKNTDVVCEFVQSRFLDNPGLVTFTLTLTRLDIYTPDDNVAKSRRNWIT